MPDIFEYVPHPHPHPHMQHRGDWAADGSRGGYTSPWLTSRRCLLPSNATPPGQVIDVLAAEQRDHAAARRFFTRALADAPQPVDVASDRAAAYPRVLDELAPAAHPVVER